MDTSLQSISMQLDEKLRELYSITQNELNAINVRIEELNQLLQMKEMNTDRSENASYQIARDERDIKIAIRSKLQQRLATLEAGTGPYSPTGYITLGTTVEFSVISIDGKPFDKLKNCVAKIVEHSLSQAKLGFIAVDGKAGAAFLGKCAGDTVLTRTLKGDVLYKIERIY